MTELVIQGLKPMYQEILHYIMENQRDSDEVESAWVTLDCMVLMIICSSRYYQKMSIPQRIREMSQILRFIRGCMTQEEEDDFLEHIRLLEE